MSKNSRRHRRAYVAGARDGIARLRGALAPLLTAEARPALDRLAATITDEFPMPPAWRHPNAKTPARHEEEAGPHG